MSVAVPLERAESAVARRIVVTGTVQGVGFRPFVYRLAAELGVTGWVANAGGCVVLEVSGAVDTLDELTRRLRSDAPPRAVVKDVVVTDLAGTGREAKQGFSVLASQGDVGVAARELPADIGTCDDCLRELFDPRDRRYRYPFINCTNCGPRATIIDDLPYDRTRTVMAGFPLCPDCAAEYGNVVDRRFHAEPIACPSCGPHLFWRAPAGRDQAAGTDALAEAVARIKDRGVIAVKGLGGYQLICDATWEPTVRMLRERKHRPVKPFAVMVRNLQVAQSLANLTEADEELLLSPARPIVLVDRRPAGSSELASAVAGGSPRVGLFLPYTPLHHLLLHDLDRPLVVTSGNRADEPIAIDVAEADSRLAGIADGFLHHNRPIRARYDDSVTRVADHGPSVIRRARGYAPAPLTLPVPAVHPILGAGAQLKHTFTLADRQRAIVGPHTGDLEDADTLDAFTATLRHLSRLQDLEPRYVAHDLHPTYLSTQFAKRWPASYRVPVQHHHAHVASCAAEHGISGPFIGVAYDGLGLGDDGTFWGGEILLADLAGYRRVGRFGTAPLPGGQAAVRHPARMALGYLLGAEQLGSDQPTRDEIHLLTERLDRREVAVVRRMIERKLNAPLASSAGRLFDAAASLLGLCDTATYEGEAAVKLEAAASGWPSTIELPWRLTSHGGCWVYDPVPTLRSLISGRAERASVDSLAAAFHQTITAVTVALVEQAVKVSRVRTVCLSGGCFQSNLLARTVPAALRADGLRVLINRSVPVNDGGISYGQVAVAAARLRHLPGGG
jgi:hydrogenase maturation protein HypF